MHGVIPDIITILYSLKNNDKESIQDSVAFDTQNKSAILKANKSKNYSEFITVFNVPKSIFILKNVNNIIKVDYDGYCLDLKKSYLADSLVSNNFQFNQNIIIQDSFIFVFINKKLTLVPISSNDYLICQENTRLAKAKILPSSKLKVGFVYRKKNKKQYLYLGKVNTTSISSISKDLEYTLEDKSDIHCSILLKNEELDFDVSDVLFEKDTKFIEEIKQIDNCENYLEKIKIHARQIVFEAIKDIHSTSYAREDLLLYTKMYSMHMNLCTSSGNDVFDIKMFLGLI